jgi:hypothetical protein
MSLTTSWGNAKVGQLCEALGISRQAYYAARKAPASEESQGLPPSIPRPAASEPNSEPRADCRIRWIKGLMRNRWFPM